jgi:DNA-binding NarL/FixJ family response regulator
VSKIRANLGAAVSAKKWTEGELIDQAEAIRHAQDLCSRLTTSHLWSSQAPARRNKRRIRQEFGGLTAREREVALLIMQGKTNREIATALVISERTVDKHVGQIFSKLGFHTRTQVAAWAVEQTLSETS